MSYNKNWIDSINIKKIVKLLTRHKIISHEQSVNINSNFESRFYSPNLFIRIGLFFFTFILANAALGIFGMTVVAALDNQSAYGILCMVAAGILYFVLHFFISKKNHFKSGIDDCLLYMTVFFAVAGLLLIANVSDPKPLLILSLPFLIVAGWRFMDSFLALLSFIGFLALIFLFSLDIPMGKLFLPFIIFIVSATVAWSADKSLKKDKYIYWENALKVLKVAGLFCAYLSLNYFVVKEGNMLLNETTLTYPSSKEYQALQARIDANREIIDNSYADSTTALSESDMTVLNKENDSLYAQMYAIEQSELNEVRSGSMPLAWLFIIATMLFPVVYIYFGLKNKDRSVLLTGMVILALTVVTYKYYNHFFPLEYTITFAGLIMLISAWWSIRYLKLNNKKFTYDQDPDENHQGLLNAEAFVVSQTFAQQGPNPVQGPELGGGDFGGGGAGGNY